MPAAAKMRDLPVVTPPPPCQDRSTPHGWRWKQGGHVMDAPRFDAMTKAWTRLPRRRVLGGLVAGTLAPLLGLGGKDVNAISGACQRSSDCDPGQACVHHTCTLTCTDPVICVDGTP